MNGVEEKHGSQKQPAQIQLYGAAEGGGDHSKAGLPVVGYFIVGFMGCLKFDSGFSGDARLFNEV